VEAITVAEEPPARVRDRAVGNGPEERPQGRPRLARRLADDQDPHPPAQPRHVVAHDPTEGDRLAVEPARTGRGPVGPDRDRRPQPLASQHDPRAASGERGPHPHEEVRELSALGGPEAPAPPARRRHVPADRSEHRLRGRDDVQVDTAAHERRQRRRGRGGRRHGRQPGRRGDRAQHEQDASPDVQRLPLPLGSQPSPASAGPISSPVSISTW
jgi:hypothetical protein